MLFFKNLWTNFLLLFQRRFLIEIRFKSGNKMQAWVRKFNVTYNGNTITKMTWTTAQPNPFIYIDTDQIEQIGIVQVRGTIFPERD